MMGRQSGQLGMQVIDMEMMIPQGHLLRKIDKKMRFDFIYELLAPYYPPNGRPSVDPVSMFKMLLVGYLLWNQIRAQACGRSSVKPCIPLVLRV